MTPDRHPIIDNIDLKLDVNVHDFKEWQEYLMKLTAALFKIDPCHLGQAQRPEPVQTPQRPPLFNDLEWDEEEQLYK